MAEKATAQKAKSPARKARQPASKVEPPPQSSTGGEPGALPDVTGSEKLEAWLRDRPPEISVVVAARAALRVLPLIAKEFEIQEQGSEIADEIVSPVFRSVALAWVAAKYPERSSVLNAFAARAAASSPADTASVMSNLAARAVYARHNLAAKFATRAADSTTYEFDIRQIADGVSTKDLAGAPLWPDGLSDDFRSLWQELKENLLSLDQSWEVWSDWYDARLEGRPSNEALEVARATIGDDIWQQGPRAVNAHIRDLIKQHEDGPPSPPTPGPADQPSPTAPQSRPNVWLAQFTQGRDRVSQWVRDAGPGSEIPWKVGKADIADIKGTDRVVYWRTVTKGRDRGGIVGTGLVTDPDPVADDNGVLRIPTEVSEFFDDTPLGRDDVIRETGLAPDHWRFSLYRLPLEVAEKMDAHLRANGREPLFADAVGQPFAGAGETVFLDDAPERDDDSLGRADLAFMLAARLNLVWDHMNNAGEANPASGADVSSGAGDHPPDSNPDQAGEAFDSAAWTGDLAESAPADEAGFVVHIDAPWGGGKTSFANYLTSILNPYSRPGPLPDWLKKLPLANKKSWPIAYRRPWHIVTFNAWQHQHVNPPWWCFYQAIRKQALRALVHEVNAQNDNPVIPTPQPAYGYADWHIRQMSGAEHWLREAMWRLFTPHNIILLAIAVPTLSIAAYGFFNGWFTDAGKPGAFLTALATLLTGGLSFVWAAFSTITTSLVPGTPDAAKNYSLGAGDPLERFRAHFVRTMEHLKRPIIVVVDDIDRCEPQFVVELIRGMQTILRSPRVVFLLLGDRDWLEQAFAETHKAMKGIEVGPEHTFGGRFVEKAIQLSIVLPVIPPDERSVYVRTLLGVDTGLADPVEQLADEQREQVERSLLSLDETANPVARDKSAAEMRTRVLGFEAISDEVKKAVTKTIDRRVALRSAADEKVHAATRHRLEPIAGVLPPNPRQIKRIINAISLFQEVARLRMQILPETTRWRQLALWIVLMTEWPQTWMTLATWPDLVDHVHKPTGPVDIGGLEPEYADRWIKDIRANREAMALIDFPSNREVPDGWEDSRIDAKAIRDLTVILPPTSGETLEKPARQAETAANGG